MVFCPWYLSKSLSDKLKPCIDGEEKTFINVRTTTLNKQYYKGKALQAKYKKRSIRVIWDIFLYWSTFPLLRSVIDNAKISVISAWCMLSRSVILTSSKEAVSIKTISLLSPTCPNILKWVQFWKLLRKRPLGLYLFILTYPRTWFELDRLRAVNQSVA